MNAGAALGRSWTAGEVAAHIGATLLGDSSVEVRALDTLDRADERTLSFIRDERYAKSWSQSRAGCAIVTRALADAIEPGPGRALLAVDDADTALVSLLEMVAPPHEPPRGRHPSAAVDPSATLGEGVALGPGVVIGPGCVVGDGCLLGPNAVLGVGVRLGAGCDLRAGVVVQDRCLLGDRVLVHPGAVVGADGFGYRPGKAGLVKVPHAGAVRIGDDVEIGANACIDRGKFGDTRIGDGTKIDNLVQIGHNCEIGRHCLICGHTGLAGSVRVGDGAILGGGVGIRDNITIGAGAKVGARSGVMADIPPGEEWVGVPAAPRKDTFRSMAALRRLPETLREIDKELRRLGDANKHA